MKNHLDYKTLLIPEAQKEFPFLWAVYKDTFPHISDRAIAIMVSIAADICGDCHESFGRCYCTRDD